MPKRDFRKRVDNAINDSNLQTALDRAMTEYYKNWVAAVEGIDFETLRTQLRSNKEAALDRIPELFDRFKLEAQRIGAQVHTAEGADDVSRLVLEIARSSNARKIVKSKSMVTEELGLNPRLISAGLEVVETDLGEWILQLCGERPSNLTMPAMHKTREQVAAILSKEVGEEIPPDIPLMVNLARKHIRQAFLEADMGISGANIAIADTGTLVIVSNEGNARLVTSLPDVHVAILTYEKLVPSLDEAASILKLLSKCATGQKMTSYVSFITGPSRTSDIEKTLTLGCHGPKELHIIFVDNGRFALLNDPEFREALCCIKCGACLAMCPVYRSVGGHVFGNRYFGGIGAVLEAFLTGPEDGADIADICLACGRCTTYCPSKIDIPRMVLALRRKISETTGQPLVQKAILRGLLGKPELFDKALDIARKTQPVWSPLKNLLIPRLAGLKNVPSLADKPLHQRIAETTAAKSTRRGVVAFYPGCLIEHAYPEIGEAVVSTLSALGWEVRLPRAQACCGFPALSKGDVQTARSLAEHNVRIRDFATADYVVTACPTCQTALKLEFSRLLAEDSADGELARVLSLKVYSWSEFVYSVSRLTPEDFPPFTEESALPIPGPHPNSSFRVTYHDPCHARHTHGTVAASREILRLAGYNVVEMPHSDACCGFAGSYSFSHPEISRSISNRKIESILSTGAQIVATDCPGCLTQLRAMLKNVGSNVKVFHTAQLLGEIVVSR
jgi:iron-sulfur cluster protein